MSRPPVNATPNCYSADARYWDVWLVVTPTYEFVFVHDPKRGVRKPVFRVSDPPYEVLPLGASPAGWLEGELSDNGWTQLLGLFEWRDDTEGETWLLQNGLAREQPFKVRVQRPRCVVHRGMDGTEYDTEYFDYVILERAERSDEFAARRWGEDFEMWCDVQSGLWIPKAACWPFEASP